MKIGIFDSGLGGLIIAKAIRKAMPRYDYVYLGDTKRVPYGNRSEATIYEFSKEAVNYLFRKENCALVIVACNTVSARALRKLQREYLPKNFSNKNSQRKVLGVLIPAAEEAGKFTRVGILGTKGTISSNTFPKEIKKLNKNTKVFQNAAPILVPLIEEGDSNLSEPFIKKYLQPLLKQKIDALVLGCTHYPILKKEIKRMLNKNLILISQDEIVPKKLKNYLTKHYEISKQLSKNNKMQILVTDKTPTVITLTKKWFGVAKPKLVQL